MEVRDLKAFVLVSELGSFTRAAERLHLAQPAVSQQIKRLERDLGSPVLRRSTRRVELTAAGERLLPSARSILGEIARTEEDIRLIDRGGAGRVSVGFVGTATYDLLPQIARTVGQQLPGISLEIYGEGLTPELIDGVAARRLDIAIVRDPQPKKGLALTAVRSEVLIAVLPIDHSAATSGHVALADLRDSTFVTHPSGHRSAMHRSVVDACRRAGFTPAKIVEVRETATLVAFVAAGMGVALVPEPVRSLSLDGVAYASITDVRQESELVMATRVGTTSPAVQAVATLIAPMSNRDRRSTPTSPPW